MQVKAMRICGGPVSIVYSDEAPLGEHDLGHLDTYKDEITIRESCPETVQARALMHEVVHHIGIQNGLAMGPENEDVVSAFSSDMLAFIRENPGMVLELMLEANGRESRLNLAMMLLDNMVKYIQTVYGTSAGACVKAKSETGAATLDVGDKKSA